MMERASDLYRRLGIRDTTDQKGEEISHWLTAIAERKESPVDQLRDRQQAAFSLMKLKLKVSGLNIRDSKNRSLASFSPNFKKMASTLIWLVPEMIECVDDVYKARQQAVASDRMLGETQKVRKEAIEKGTTKGARLRKVGRFLDEFVKEVREKFETEEDPVRLRDYIRVLLGDEKAPESVYRRRRRDNRKGKENNGQDTLPGDSGN